MANNLNDYFERTEIFKKVLKMVETSSTQDHLEACRNYFNEYVRMYGNTTTEHEEFERNFEEKKTEILKKDLQNERNGRKNKHMAIQGGFSGFR